MDEKRFKLVLLHLWLNWIEHQTSDLGVGGSSPSGCTDMVQTYYFKPRRSDFLDLRFLSQCINITPTKARLSPIKVDELGSLWSHKHSKIVVTRGIRYM